MKYGLLEEQTIAIAKLGIKEFEVYRDKALKKIQAREMEHNNFVH